MPKKISEQAFMDLYGNKKVKFYNYYKYIFIFKGYLEEYGCEIYCTVGNGCGDEIYKLDITADEEYSLLELQPNSA